MKYLIMFDRDGNDEILPTEASKSDVVEQLRKELLEADIGTFVVRGIIETASTERRFVILIELFFGGTRQELVNYLQAAYDNYGIEGFFETCEPEWSSAF